MKKDEAVKIIVECAKEYSKNLINLNLLFVFEGAEESNHIETIFLPQNFMHLTGVAPRDRLSSSVAFYNACVGGKLTPAFFDMNHDGTTRIKLSILFQVMNIHKVARMVGDFNGNNLKLNTEKILGNVHACMGFVCAQQHQGLFVPNTALREDIRDVSEKPTRKILAILRKPKDAKMYSECTYIAKGISLEELLSVGSLKLRVDI